MTLQEIGEIFDVTRMRICQIEKSVMRKMSDQLDEDISS
jgi:DNA-directed RNA polymerase sigma subunit (sigma70/sigma32)